MTDDRRDRITVRWRPTGRAPRRLVFEPRSDGGWLREEQTRIHDGTWRTVGTETCTDLAFEGPIPPQYSDD
jgi:hypothetical protein